MIVYSPMTLVFGSLASEELVKCITHQVVEFVCSYECKLCLTLHNNEGNYLAHTQGKRHQTNLAKRAAREAKDAPAQPQPNKRKVNPRKTGEFLTLSASFVSPGCKGVLSDLFDSCTLNASLGDVLFMLYYVGMHESCSITKS